MQILSLGKFLPSDIKVTLSESNRKIKPELESQVDQLWEQEQATANKLGKVCYNGVSYRLNSLNVINNKLEIDFGTIEYKVVNSLRMIPLYVDLAEEYYCKNCYVSVSVKTSDNFYLLVKLSGKSMNKNLFDMVGGILEKPLEIKNSNDVFQAVKNEMSEETCVGESEIDDLYLRSVFLNAKWGICFYFESILKIDSKAIIKKFQKNKQDQDIADLVFLDKDSYVKTLQSLSASKKAISEMLNI